MGAKALPDVTAATAQADIGICLVDMEFRYTWVNDAFSALLGYASEDLVGRSPVEFTHPDDVDLDLELSEKAFRGEIPHFHTRKRFIRKDGSILVGELLATVAFEDSEAVGGFAVLIDASQSDPTTQRIESLQRSAAIGQMTASAVHDLRNNVGAIGLVGDALEAQYGLLPAIELLKYEVEGTMQLLSAISGYVGPTKTTRSYDAIGEVLTRINPLLRLLVPAATALDVVVIDPALTPTIEARELEQVITNLLLNARDAINSVGGLISITAGATTGDPDCVDIIVRDNGSGMNSDELAQAFTPYFTTKGDNGTGLGLTICRDIVERNGGRLDVTSERGVGSEFVIRLPVALTVEDVTRQANVSEAEPRPLEGRPRSTAT